MKGCKEEFVSLSEGFAAFAENHFNQDMLEILSLFFENVALSSKQAFIRVVPAQGEDTSENRKLREAAMLELKKQAKEWLSEKEK